MVDEFTLGASNTRIERLAGWADRFMKREWAVESGNGLGYLIARQLVGGSETVFDVPGVGVTDPVDGFGEVAEE